MLQLRYGWRTLDPINALDTAARGITIRGASKVAPVALPSEFALALTQGKVPHRPSIGDIMFRVCETRRDQYLAMAKLEAAETWGGTAGILAEKYFRQLVTDHFSYKPKKPVYDYQLLRDASQKAIEKFTVANAKKFKKLSTFPTPGNQTDWLQHCLQYAGTHEIAAQELDIELTAGTGTHARPDETRISPDPILGISKTATPDFIFPDLRTVGDMKTGRELKEHHLLTCAGYALAYESEHPDEHIDFGLVYFFPTQQRTLSFAQVHAFVIDDELRRKFLDMRDDVYTLLIRHDGKEPAFPSNKEKCPNCKYVEYCRSKGLKY